MLRDIAPAHSESFTCDTLIPKSINTPLAQTPAPHSLPLGVRYALTTMPNAPPPTSSRSSQALPHYRVLDRQRDGRDAGWGMRNKASSILGEPLVGDKRHTALWRKDIDHKPAYLPLPLEQPSSSTIWDKGQSRLDAFLRFLRLTTDILAQN